MQGYILMERIRM